MQNGLRLIVRRVRRNDVPGSQAIRQAMSSRRGGTLLMTTLRGPDGEILVWKRSRKPHGMTVAQYRCYPKQLTMRQVTVDARDKNNRAEQFKVVTTILDASIDGEQLGS